ncbi:MAG: hypothetical protein ACYTFO_02135 [Planctomycetota bacterium]|jgi:hypothetical protein
MDTQPQGQLQHPRSSWPERILVILACVCTAGLLAALSYRPITSVDLPYHLAYGQEFWRAGEIVQDDRFVAPPVDPAGIEATELPPGASFDDEGNYYFPNANWLSQIILAGLWRLGGWPAMNITLALGVAAIAIGQAVLLRRLGGSWAWLPAAWLATAIIGNERFMLRPELFVYVVLIAQLCLLVGQPTWRSVGAVVGLQLLAVNLHSYWPLGVMLVLAFAGEAALKALWAKVIVRQPIGPERRRRLGRLAVCSVLVVAAAMAHPAGPANAIFPIQTLEFLSRHEASAAETDTLPGQTGDAWRLVGELNPTFESDWWRYRSVRAMALLVAAGAAAGVVLLMRRHWALAGILAGSIVVGLGARRNMAVAAFLGAPLIAAGGRQLKLLLDRRAIARQQADVSSAPPNWPRILGVVALIVMAGLSGRFIYGVTTNAFYLTQSYVLRFGRGYSKLVMPLDTCRWLDEDLPEAQGALVDIPSSSSVMFFSKKVTGVPYFTNGWAVPTERMSRVLALTAGQMPLETLRAWGLDVAILRGWPGPTALHLALMDSPDWALVHVESCFAVFVRRTPANEALIAASEIMPSTFDAPAFIDTCRDVDVVPAIGLRAGAMTIQGMGWTDQAVPVWRACVADPVGKDIPEAWLYLGGCLSVRGRQRLDQQDRSGLADLREARQCLRQALVLRRDYPEAIQYLQAVDRLLRQSQSSTP